LTYRESLRGIEVNLRAQAKRLYHMGLRCKTVYRFLKLHHKDSMAQPKLLA
jgi:hypothetical protein